MPRDDDGGGGGDFSSIKFEGMSSLVSAVKSAGSTLQDTTKTLQSQASSCSVSCAAFSQIIEIGAWAEDQVAGLQRRLTLATAMENVGGSRLSEWTIGEPVTMTAAEAEKTGSDLAQKLKDQHSTDDNMADAYHEVAGQLGAYSNDPDVLSVFYGSLGPQLTQMIPTLLDASGDDDGPEDLAAYSKAFGAAMKDPYPSQGFTAVADSFTQPLDKENKATQWARLAFMQSGDFPADYVAQVVRANGLTQFSDEGYEYDWRGGFGNRLGLSEDNVALMFSALENNPEGARQAFAGLDLNNITKTVYGTVEALGTGSDIAQAYALAISAASGSNDEVAGSHSSGAVDFTLAFIKSSAAVRDVPQEMQAALGQLAASYAPEFVAGAQSQDAGNRESGMSAPADFNKIPGLDPQFYLSPQDVYKFIHGFGSDEKYSQPFDEAVGSLYTDLLGKAATAKRADPENDDWNTVLGTFGQLAGFEYQAQKDVRGDMDEADKKMRELVGSVLSFGLGKIPGPEGVAAKYGWKLTSYVVGKGISAFQEGDPEKTREALLDDDNLKASFLVNYHLAETLYNAHYPGMAQVPPELKDGDHLKPPGEIAKSADLIAAYQKWTDSTDTGKQSDLDKLLDDGELVFRGGQGKTEDLIKGDDSYDW